MSTRQCPRCGGRKDHYALVCRACKRPDEWAKVNLGKTGPAHTAWKGGFQIDRDGYIRTYAPDHPWPRRGGYVLEHVRRMELAIGRRMERHECVHHVDHDRQNNSLENLVVLSKGEHSSLHRRMEPPQRRDSLGRFVGGGVGV